MAITIRLASLDDAKALLDIYRYYVEETAITFEYDVPTLEEFTGRMRSIMAFILISWQKKMARFLAMFMLLNSILELLMLGQQK